MAKIMKETPKLGEFLKDSVLIPVPLHFARKMKRGYNQSEIIANAAIRAFPNSGITISNALRRTKRTDTQTHLTKEERLENIKGAFKAVSYTHLRAHETGRKLVCRNQLEK